MFSVPIRQTELKISIIVLITIILLFFLLTGSKNNLLEINSAETTIPPTIWSEDDLFMLNGFWEFFPGKYIPTNYNGSGEKLIVPGTWESAFYDEDSANKGFGSYRLRLKLPISGAYGMKVSDIANSCAIYINGKLEYSRGDPGTSEALSEPGYTTGRFFFDAEVRDIEIVIHVSNFNDEMGGITESIILGNSSAIDYYHQTSLTLQMLLLGAMLILFLLNHAMYYISDKEKLWLFLSLLSLAVSIRIIATGEIFLGRILSTLNWYIYTRVENLIFCLSGIILADFYYNRFNWLASKRLISIVKIISGLFAILVLALPLTILELVFPIYKVVAVSLMFILILTLIKASIRKEDGAFLSLSVLIIFMISLVIDGMYRSNVIDSTYALLAIPLAEIVFNFIQGLWILFEEKNELYIQKIEKEQENSQLKLQEDDLKKENLDLFRKVIIDPQTELLNHRNLELKFESGEGSAPDEETTIITIDILNLKEFKEELGRKSIDSIVKWFAGTLIRSARKKDHIYRISDNEFAIIMNESEIAVSKFIAKKLENSIAKVNLNDLLINQIDIHPSYLKEKQLLCRIGISIKPRGVRLSLEELLQRSEYAMRSVHIEGQHSSGYQFYKE